MVILKLALPLGPRIIITACRIWNRADGGGGGEGGEAGGGGNAMYGGGQRESAIKPVQF